MPTILSHAAVPLAMGLGLGDRVISRPLLAVGILASVLPDLDVVAFRFHVAYSNTLGHRGASHSLAFALLLALLAMACARWLRTTPRSAFAFVGASAASHGLLDMLTNGGLGVALWWPLSPQRFFAPWQGIEASPLSLQRVFSARGWAVFQSELLWVWLPAAACSLILWALQRAYLKPRSV
ncbi:MAG: metal-dependent hydrolase [Rhizobacter sp.]